MLAIKEQSRPLIRLRRQSATDIQAMATPNAINNNNNGNANNGGGNNTLTFNAAPTGNSLVVNNGNSPSSTTVVAAMPTAAAASPMSSAPGIISRPKGESTSPSASITTRNAMA